jgi:hypothetical protein
MRPQPTFCTFEELKVSLIERRAQNGDYKMSEMGRTFVELKVADNTMVGEIFCHTRFGYAEVLSESWLEGLGAMAAGGTAQKAADGETQSLASFDMIVGGEIGVAQKEHAGTNGCAIPFTELQWRTG